MINILFVVLGAFLASVAWITYNKVFRDLGGAIFCTPSQKEMYHMVKSFAEAGVWPEVWLPSKVGTAGNAKLLVNRAGMKGGAIINYAAQSFFNEEAGGAAVGYQFIDHNPLALALHLERWFQTKGYEVCLRPDPDPTISKGKMVFVVVRGLIQNNQPFIFVCRRHKRFMGKKFSDKPLKWSQRSHDLKMVD